MKKMTKVYVIIILIAVVCGITGNFIKGATGQIVGWTSMIIFLSGTMALAVYFRLNSWNEEEERKKKNLSKSHSEILTFLVRFKASLFLMIFTIMITLFIWNNLDIRKMKTVMAIIAFFYVVPYPTIPAIDRSKEKYKDEGTGI